MKSFLLSIIIIILFSICNIYSQDITATLSGNTSRQGFSVVNALSDTVFRVTGEGNVGIYPSVYQNTPNPTSIFEVQGSSSGVQFGRGINLVSESGIANAGTIVLKGGSGLDMFGRGGNINILGGSSNNGSGRGGSITISGGNGSFTGGVTINTGSSGFYNNTTGSISIATATNFENGAGGISIASGSSDRSPSDNSIRLTTGTNSNGGGDIILEVASTRSFVQTGNIILTPHTGGGLVKINGSGTYTGTWTQASDKRYKKNIELLQNAVEKIKQLNGVSYELKSDEFPEKNFTDGKQIGLIAQDVEKVFPEIVETDSDGYKSIAYQNMVAVLIEAIKEQQKSIDDLKKEVELLKSSTNNDNVEISSLEN